MEQAVESDDSRRWHIQGLREMVEVTRGKSVGDELWLCLRAVDDRLFYSFFHFEEMNRIVKDALGERDAQQVFVDIVLGADQEAQAAFHIPRRRAWAHVLGCLQALHALTDIVAHVLVFALDLPVTGQISMAKVRLPASRIDSELAVLLTAWLDNTEHIYLNAAVNFSKHHSLVRESLTVSLPTMPNSQFGLALESFVYKGKIFPVRWASRTLAQIHAHEAPALTRVGQRINVIVANRLAARRETT